MKVYVLCALHMMTTVCFDTALSLSLTPKKYKATHNIFMTLLHFVYVDFIWKIIIISELYSGVLIQIKLIKMLLKFIYFSVLEIKWTYATHSFKTTKEIVLYLNSFTLSNFATEKPFFWFVTMRCLHCSQKG